MIRLTGGTQSEAKIRSSFPVSLVVYTFKTVQRPVGYFIAVKACLREEGLQIAQHAGLLVLRWKEQRDVTKRLAIGILVIALPEGRAWFDDQAVRGQVLRRIRKRENLSERIAKLRAALAGEIIHQIDADILKTGSPGSGVFFPEGFKIVDAAEQFQKAVVCGLQAD